MTNANAVSRVLRAGDFLPSHPDRQYKHEGLYVRNSYRGSGAVTVHVDIDMPGKRLRLILEVTEYLRSKGYHVEPRTNDDGEVTRLHVTRPATPPLCAREGLTPVPGYDVLLIDCTVHGLAGVITAGDDEYGRAEAEFARHVRDFQTSGKK